MNKIGIPDFYKDTPAEAREELKNEFAFLEDEWFDEVDVKKTSILGSGDSTSYCYCLFDLSDPKNKNYPPTVLCVTPFYSDLNEIPFQGAEDAGEWAGWVGLIIKVKHGRRYYSMSLDDFKAILSRKVYEILEKYIKKLN